MAKSAAKQMVKKQWIPIIAPKLFSERLIGETYLAEARDAIGRSVTISSTILTNEPREQHINLGFKIIGEDKNGLRTEFVSYHFSPSSTRRYVRRNRSKVEDSFVATTSDGKKVRVKVMLVSRGKAQGGASAALKKAAREFFTLHMGKMKLEQFWNDVMGRSIQKGLMDSLRKIHPLSACEIRWALVIGEGTPPKIEVKEEAKTEKPEKAEAKPEAKAEEKSEKAEEKASAKEEAKAEKPTEEEQPEAVK